MPRPAPPALQVCAADAVLCKAVSTRRLQVVPNGSGLPVIDLSKVGHRCSLACWPACWLCGPPRDWTGRASAHRGTNLQSVRISRPPALLTCNCALQPCAGESGGCSTSTAALPATATPASHKRCPPTCARAPPPFSPAMPQVSPELAEAASGADLVVLDGMGRSIETNLHVKLRWDRQPHRRFGHVQRCALARSR